MADPDPKFEALMAVLEAQRDLMAGQKGANKTAIEKSMNETISSLRRDYEQAKTEKAKNEVYNTVADLAGHCQAMVGASLDLVRAVRSGDPFAISASTLDLTASLVSTISLAGGPIGAAVGAVLGAILSIVSMILKMFQEESETLLSQIEQLLRKLKAEDKIQELKTARGHINAFISLAMTINERNAEATIKTLSIIERNKKAIAENPAAILELLPRLETRQYSYIHGQFDKNTFTLLLGPANWLFDNEELSQWGEVLSLVCQLYANFKLGVVSWLPIVVPDPTIPGDNPKRQLMDFRDSYDKGMLEFLEHIKPAARNRGIICHTGTSGVDGHSGIFVRDVVISNKKGGWTALTGKAYAIAGAYRPGQEASPHPSLSILHLGGTETFEGDQWARSFLHAWRNRTVQDVERADQQGNPAVRSEIMRAKLHPFSKKTLAYDLDGHWPLAPGKWDHLTPIEKDGEAYDIWAIPGSSPGEIDVYTATGDDIRRYTEKGGDEHIKLNRTNPTAPSFKAGAVRAVRPKTLAGEDKKVLEDYTEVVYELCEDGNNTKDYPFKLWAFFMSPGKPTVDGTILPFRPLDPKDWRNFPVGIAVDSLRFWVFSKFFIACASHTNVKQHLEKNKEATPDWMVYNIPSDLLSYDPSNRVSMGLLDLSACDDGTLTAVFEDEDSDGWGRIFTATPRFEGGKLIIEGTERDDRDHETKTHGWVKDPDTSTYARRVHKLPIFCWPMIEGLENALKSK